MSYELGVIFGLIVAIFVFLVVYKRRKAGKCEYDERQELARGKAFRYAFFTALIVNAVMICYYSFHSGSDLNTVIRPEYFAYASLVLSLLVFVSYAIFKDAYMGFNETYRRTYAIILIIGVVNLISGLPIRDGELSFMNLGLGILFVVVAIEITIKRMLDNKNANSDEDGEI